MRAISDPICSARPARGLRGHCGRCGLRGRRAHLVEDRDRAFQRLLGGVHLGGHPLQVRLGLGEPRQVGLVVRQVGNGVRVVGCGFDALAARNLALGALQARY